eukprot:CAMPEP_0115067820 /NCGR_PEP_ID=MMETSP0227-20121206/11617_1 /TAXON_ID=89957 /ORGANISM="Polarella glacialis, Strain CCMP 1383" /LENGTH=141 /DNA_ID=CAMNT_0002453959 /DNA_START=55 /DNA_END=480 /DNA_ORIENTATION=-
MAGHAGLLPGGTPSIFRCLIADWKAVNKDSNLKTDSKVPLAIERTLLRWLRSAVILSSLSAFLSSFSDMASKVNGALLGVVALLFVFLPLFKFVRRSLDLTKAVAKQPMTDRYLVDLMAMSTATILLAVLCVDMAFNERSS